MSTSTVWNWGSTSSLTVTQKYTLGHTSTSISPTSKPVYLYGLFRVHMSYMQNVEPDAKADLLKGSRQLQVN